MKSHTFKAVFLPKDFFTLLLKAEPAFMLGFANTLLSKQWVWPEKV